jgi:hypothetical protein
VVIDGSQATHVRELLLGLLMWWGTCNSRIETKTTSRGGRCRYFFEILKHFETDFWSSRCTFSRGDTSREVLVLSRGQRHGTLPSVGGASTVVSV